MGTEGNEIGEYVVSKVTYQKEKVKDEGESSGVRGGPTTPMTNTPTPPRPVDGGAGDGEAFDDDKMFDPFYEVVFNNNHKKKTIGALCFCN